ncbi:uncharacterized protein LOC113791568 isoform X1 [Dermatophagoides pteronyssinus]|uniref:Uncharacterized protein LOC113791568 n=1 Tax=Dermatophagoides pteronyssinus TaxID=6956 RepID=A0A6P6XUR3_DERPT|nr:uncharacterized protein LOC113791568 [Dermatophagoides pteronyssinus]
MSKQASSAKLRRLVEKLYGWTFGEIIAPNFFIAPYQDLIGKVETFVESYGSYNIDDLQFRAIQAKVEKLLNSSDISSEDKDSLESYYNRGNCLLSNLPKLKHRRQFDKHHPVIKSLSAMKRGEIKTVICCEQIFSSYSSMYLHVKSVHSELYVDENRDQDQDHPAVDVEPSTSAFDMEILNEEEPSLHSVEPQVKEPESLMLFDPIDDEEDEDSDVLIIDEGEPEFDPEHEPEFDSEFEPEVEPEEEPGDDVHFISSDRVDCDFLNTVRNKLSDSDYAIFDSWCQKFIESRVLFNATIPGLHNSIPTYASTLSNPDLRYYLTRMADSSFLQEKFAMMDARYIQPKAFYLDNGKSYYYIPIREILTKYVLNDDLVHIIRQENTDNVSPYVRNNGFHGKLRLMIYGDEFGICNPLRESSRKYKVYVLYLDINNRKFTSKKRDVHLLMIWCPNDLKTSSQSLLDIMSPLSGDLLKLIREGIMYDLNGQSIQVPVCLSHILGDNLSVAELLGLRRSFGPAFACRHCGIQRSQLSSLDDNKIPFDTIHRSYGSYQKELNLVLSNKQYISPFGITCRPAFDKLGINVYQIAPADIFHDLAEGVVPLVIGKSFEILKAKLGLDRVRSRFSSFKIWVNGKIGINFQDRLIKIRGKGWQRIELAVRLVELFPEMTENPSDYAIYFHLRKVIFFVFSPSAPCISELRSAVREFIRLCHEMRLNTPKVHFISHYPELTEFYGTLSRFSTDKYERFHSYLKKLLCTSKNFLNVPCSLSKRNQMAQPFLWNRDQSVPVEGTLSSLDFPFPLGRRILRILLTDDNSFIEARQFVVRNSETFVRGRLWTVTDRNSEINVHKVNLSSDSCEQPLSGLSHLNSYLFKYQGLYFVNYSMMK